VTRPGKTADIYHGGGIVKPAAHYAPQLRSLSTSQPYQTMSGTQPKSAQSQEEYIALEMSPYDQTPSKPTHRPTIPARLDRLHRQSWGLAIVYVLSALSPLAFFVVGVLAFCLHGKPLSEWGDHLQKVILLVRGGLPVWGSSLIDLPPGPYSVPGGICRFDGTGPARLCPAAVGKRYNDWPA
jgi:hypothetical protein